MPQLPYVPLGGFRAVVSYPNEEGAVGDREIQQALIKVALSHWSSPQRLRDWAQRRSRSVTAADRVRPHPVDKPKAVFLDESTSAMDAGLELTLYELIRAELPRTIWSA